MFVILLDIERRNKFQKTGYLTQSNQSNKFDGFYVGVSPKIPISHQSIDASHVAKYITVLFYLGSLLCHRAGTYK